jgi:hypothetical protein
MSTSSYRNIQKTKNKNKLLFNQKNNKQQKTTLLFIEKENHNLQENSEN